MTFSANWNLYGQKNPIDLLPFVAFYGHFSYEISGIRGREAEECYCEVKRVIFLILEPQSS